MQFILVRLRCFCIAYLIWHNLASIDYVCRYEKKEPLDELDMAKRFYFQNHFESQLIRQRYAGNDIQPEEISVWGDLVSDQALSDLAFKGLGMYYVRRFEKQGRTVSPASSTTPTSSPTSRTGKKHKNQELPMQEDSKDVQNLEKFARNHFENDAQDELCEHFVNQMLQQLEFLIDFSAMAECETREGLERCGAVAYFDKNRKVVAIYYCEWKRFFFPTVESKKFGGKGIAVPGCFVKEQNWFVGGGSEDGNETKTSRAGVRNQPVPNRGACYLYPPRTLNQQAEAPSKEVNFSALFTAEGITDLPKAPAARTAQEHQQRNNVEQERSKHSLYNLLDWERAKFAFRSAMFTYCTLRSHLFELHWVISNGLAVAARKLPKGHFLRKILKAHTFRTVAINWSSVMILLPENMLAFRVFPFSKTGWQKFFTNCLVEWKYMTLEEKIKEKNLHFETTGEPNIRLAQDNFELKQIVRKHVSDLLKTEYDEVDELYEDTHVQDFYNDFREQLRLPRETDQQAFKRNHFGLPKFDFGGTTSSNGEPRTINARSSDQNDVSAKTMQRFWDTLVDFVAEEICMVTGGHLLLGSLSEYFSDCNVWSGKIYKDSRLHSDDLQVCCAADLDSYLLGLMLLVATGAQQPLLLDEHWLEQIYALDKEEEQEKEKLAQKKKIVLNTKNELLALVHRIQERNKGEENVKWNACNPVKMESSVSI